MSEIEGQTGRRWRPSDARRAKVTLSTLWVFAVLNYIYADVISLFDRTNLNALLAGEVDSMQITEGFLLGGAVLMETAMVMVVLSRALPYRANRWANIASGVLHTVAVAGSLTVGHLALYYAFFAAVEIGCTVLIVGYAWRWVESAPCGDVAAATAGFSDSGQVVPVIDRKYPLDQAADAVRRVEGHQALGKIVVTVGGLDGHGGPSKEKQ